MPKSLHSRLEVLEVAARIGAAPFLVLFRDPEPGEVERHLASGGGPVLVLNIAGRGAEPTDRPPP